ncbi:hypothetical protein ACFE04_003137 [Oxalis oulophora]
MESEIIKSLGIATKLQLNNALIRIFRYLYCPKGFVGHLQFGLGPTSGKRWPLDYSNTILAGKLSGGLNLRRNYFIQLALLGILLGPKSVTWLNALLSGPWIHQLRVDFTR